MIREGPRQRHGTRLTGAVALLALHASLAGGADYWLLAEPAGPRPGQTVEVRWMSGAALRGEPRPYAAKQAVLLQRLARNGRVNLDGAEGETLTRFKAGGPGLELIVYNARSATAPEPDIFCKALLVVGDAGESDPLRWSELGQRLELVPQTDPVKLARGDRAFELQVLFEREPLAGARVFAVPDGAPVDGRKRSVTDEIGLARFELDRPGRWMVLVEHEAPCGDCAETRSPRRWFASLVFSTGS